MFHPVEDDRYPARAARRSGSPSYRKKIPPPATANTSGFPLPVPVPCSSYNPNSETPAAALDVVLVHYKYVVLVVALVAGGATSTELVTVQPDLGA